MASTTRDLLLAVRGLRRRPLLAVSAVLALGLGVGATTTVFSFDEGVLVAPLPYPAPERLVRVWDARPERGVSDARVSPGRFADWRRRVGSFASMGAARVTPGHLVGGPEPRAGEVHRTAGDFFATLGVHLVAGRAYTAAEAERGAPLVVLDRALARRLFGGGSPLGRQVRLDGTEMEVVGVAEGEEPPLGHADLWAPLTGVVWENRVSHVLDVFARLRPDATAEQAAEELAAAGAAAAREHAATDAGWQPRLVSLRDEVVAPARPALVLLSVAALLVLAVAAVNVGGLLLARALGRSREIALRLALGSGRLPLLRALLAESLVLAVLGSAVGLLLALLGVEAFRPLAAVGLPRVDRVGLDGASVLAAVVAAVAAAALASLLPLVELRRVSLVQALQEGGRGSLPGAPRRWFDRLVVTEMALALCLLAGTGLLAAGFLRLTRVDLGFRPAGVLAVDVAPAQAGYLRGGERAELYRRLVERLGAVPGVTAAGAVSRLPLGGSGAEFRFLVEGAPAPEAAEQPTAEMRAVAGRYFAALGIPRLEGTGFGLATAPVDAPAVLVNRALAERYWPRRDAVGRRISLDGPEGPWLRVAGVVGDVHHFGPAHEVAPAIYAPLARDPWPTATLVVHTTGDPLALVPAVRAALADVAPDLPATRIVTLRQLADAALARPRFQLALVATLALLTLLLAAVGLYGTEAYQVSLRRHEIGVRMSLGARRSEVAGWVLRRAFRLALVGAAIGLVLALAAGRALADLVFGVGPADAGVLVLTTLFLLVTMLAAAWLPARRASRVEPMEALRDR